MARKPRQIVGFDVSYDKSEQRLQRLINSVLKAKYYYSDANQNYQKVSYSGQHFFFRDKSHIFTVENINSAIHKYVAALQHKSNVFRSLETFQSIMRVFVYAYNKFGEFKQRVLALNLKFFLILFSSIKIILFHYCFL